MPIQDRVLLELFSEGPVVLFIWENTPEWPVLYASSNVKALLGLDAGELIRPPRSYVPFVHPADLPRVAEEVSDAVRSGAESFTHADYRILTNRGEERWVADHTRIERAADGRITGFYGYVLDVTERHLARREAAEQHERLQLVVEGGRIGTWDWNPQGDDVVYNDQWAAMLGLSLEELEPGLAAWSSRVHPDDTAHCQAALDAHFRGETPFYESVHRMRHRDGHWVYILDRGKIVERDTTGQVVRFSGTHTDITAQKNAEVAAREADRSKSRFLARMSHEIRTPLNGILGVIQLLETTRLDTDQEDYLETIRHCGEGLLKVIDDILDYSRIEAGRLVLESQPFSPTDELRLIHDLFRERAEAGGLRFHLEIDASLPATLSGDAHRIRQIVMNLVSNAIKFTAKGDVRLRSWTTPAADGLEDFVLWTIVVEDTGKGIDDFAAIWKEFGQEDATISRRFGGTGLGLPISRRLARLMGGRLEADSTVGVGSSFTLVLPLPLASRPLGESPRTQVSVLPGLRVLVAEDNPVNRMVIGKMLERLEVDVTMVCDGIEAVEACRCASFDIVLMDIHMPGLDGIAATRQIHARVDDPPVVIGVSADVLSDNRESCAEAGIIELVTKPLRFEELTAALNRHRPSRSKGAVGQ